MCEAYTAADRCAIFHRYRPGGRKTRLGLIGAGAHAKEVPMNAIRGNSMGGRWWAMGALLLVGCGAESSAGG